MNLNNERPVQLPEKIEYLHDKIDVIHKQTKQSDMFQLKMKFIEFIDTTIEKIYTLDNKPERYKEKIKKKYQNYFSAEENQKEKERINSEKDNLNYKIKELHQKQKELEIQGLRINLENEMILKERIHKEYEKKQFELKSYIVELEKKIRSQQKELERVIKLNSSQTKEIDSIKEERNRAERNQLEWRQKYEKDLGTLESFNSKKTKYNFRSDEGLRCTRSFTNMCSEKKNTERFVLCDLPLKFHVIKIVYGIKLGIILPNRQIQYFPEVLLYQKEQILVLLQDGVIVVEYLKRKHQLRLDRIKINRPQLTVMLYGKGDSIAIDQNQ